MGNEGGIHSRPTRESLIAPRRMVLAATAPVLPPRAMYVGPTPPPLERGSEAAVLQGSAAAARDGL